MSRPRPVTVHPHSVRPGLAGVGCVLMALILAACVPSGPSVAALPDAPVPLPPGLDRPAATKITILSYHDVRSDLEGELDGDRYAVATRRLIEHFDWFLAEGLTPVSVDQVLNARSGGAPLPANPILLVFDDGLKSVYTEVFPLLKLYDYPAVVAPVGSWMDAPEGWSVPYDGLGELTREDLVSWDELRAMQASGLVEVATHTWDLHQGVRGNPQGNEQPAAVTRIHDPETGDYEDDLPYRERIRADLALAADRIEEELGRRPRIVVWPYGEYSQVTDSIARSLGMPITMGLVPRPQPADELAGMGRFVITGNIQVPDLAWYLRRSFNALSPIRVIHVDLDYVYDPDPDQIERNLDALVERISTIQPSHIYLQAFADPDGDGTARSLYFPNRPLPMRADLFNRVAWQLRTRAGVSVFAWMPLLAFDLGDSERNDALSVQRWEEGRAVPSRPDYRRLSPWHPEARRIIHDLFEDLAIHAAFDGILFHDDAYLNDREDAAAFPGSPGRLPTARERTDALFELTSEVMETVRRFRPEARSARNLYARVVLEPESEEWFAQNFPRSLEHYDHTAVMAMPYMENARRAWPWLSQLVDRVADHPGGLAGTVFELQAVDWRTPAPIPTAELVEWTTRLEQAGAIHFGYYPDDFIQGHPDLWSIRSALSVERDPWRRRLP